jgi:hypothetical protein
VLEGPTKKLQGVVDAAHGFHDDVDVGGVEELAPSRGDAGAFWGLDLGDVLTAADGSDDQLYSAAALNERSVLGDDVGGGAAHSSKSDNSYADMFHKTFVS